MSLAVPAELLEQAHHGEVADAAFLDCVRTSLPYAWEVITGLIKELEAGGAEFAGNQVPPPDEAARGELLRLMASDAMRAAIERHYGVRLAFQNCHRAAVFTPAATAALAEFTSARSQLLNQRPGFVDCLRYWRARRAGLLGLGPHLGVGHERVQYLLDQVLAPLRRRGRVLAFGQRRDDPSAPPVRDLTVG